MISLPFQSVIQEVENFYAAMDTLIDQDACLLGLRSYCHKLLVENDFVTQCSLQRPVCICGKEHIKIISKVVIICYNG